MADEDFDFQPITIDDGTDISAMLAQYKADEEKHRGKITTLEDLIGISGEVRLDRDGRRTRMEKGLTRPVRSMAYLARAQRYLGQTVAIVGGGPSLDDTIPELLELIAAGAKVMAVNKTHDDLLARGIKPTFGVMSDPKDWVAGYQTPTPGVINLLCSQCHDDTFERFKDHGDTFIWHSLGDEDDYPWLLERGRALETAVLAVEGISTTGGRCIDLAGVLGFRDLHLFAFDCSSRDNRMYAYDKPKLDPIILKTGLIDPETNERLTTEYETTAPMGRQALQLEMFIRAFGETIASGIRPPIALTVHGTGLFPDWAALRGFHHDPNRAAAVRAAGAPPTFTPVSIDLEVPQHA